MAITFHLVLLGLLATTHAWRHASRLEFERSLTTRDDTLVAFVDVSPPIRHDTPFNLEPANKLLKNQPERQASTKPLCNPFTKTPLSWNGQLLETEWSSINDPDKTLLSINCAEDATLCEEHDVRSFPAIRLYRSAKTFEYYRGPRQKDEIIAFVDRSLRPVVSGLGPNNVTTFTSIDSFVFILHLVDRDAGKGLYKRFHDLATTNSHRFSFGVVPREAEQGPSSLDCFNNLDDMNRTTSEFFTDINSLGAFIKSCSTRLVPEMTHRNKHDYTGRRTKVVYFFDFNSARREQFASDIKGLARSLSDDLQFVTVDPPSFPDVPSSTGLRWTFPAIALQDKETGLMYHSEQSTEITPAFVERFLRSVSDGTTQPAFRGPVDTGSEHESQGESVVHRHSVHDEL